MIRKISLTLALLLVTLTVVGGVILLVTSPDRPAENSASFKWLQAGPYVIGSKEYLWKDQSRTVSPNRDFPGAPVREFPVTIWYPEEFNGPYPLVVYSHGFMSSRKETAYLLEHLVSYGYVVIAADFPLTSGSAPGGPNINDVSAQPADVAFLIDNILGMAADEKPYRGEIDSDRIGLLGLSLGGLSTTLTAYHPRLREPRVRAAISIAGPAANLTRQFYTQNEITIPYLMIAGTADRLIDYDFNAAVVPQYVTNGALLTIEGGNHIGFVGMSEPAFRLVFNADSLACLSVNANIDDSAARTNEDLFSDEDGIVFNLQAPQRCESAPKEAIHPGRQHMITKLGVLGFFESVFAGSAERRNEAAELLLTNLAVDFDEARFEVGGLSR